VACLEALVGEMEERYQRFRATPGTPRDLASYNRIVPEAQRLPVRWVVHDEFADWMLIDEYKQAVQDKVERLGVKARAAGIRLIFAAQRPEDRVTPVQLRSNLGNRLVLRVESEGTSVIALNEPGAERLMGKGHLAARLEGEPDLVYAQVPLLDDRLLSELLVAIRADG